MKYRAVLFDLDGTLLDTLDDLADSMNAVLQRMNFSPHAVEAYRYFVGDGIETMACRALPENRRDHATVRRLLSGMRRHYGGHWADKTRPYDGVDRLLQALAARGMEMAVLSNKPHDSTEAMVAALLAGHRFAMVVGARPGVGLKPDPTAAVEIAECLGIPPARFLYLGDTATDMKTAVAADMYPVGALWGFRTAAELTESGAKAMIEHPEELLGLL